jgi:hypothetical protein
MCGPLGGHCTIFSCNPLAPKQFTEQKKMATFRHGCHAVEGLFPDIMLRRLDIFLLPRLAT